MRILATDQFSEFGGAQHGFLEAVRGFAHRGWDVHAVVPEGPLVPALEPLCRSVSIIPCGPYHSVQKTWFDVGRFARQLPEQARIMRRLIATHRIDALYVNGPRVLPAAAWACQSRPVLFHSHSVLTQKSVIHLTSLALRASSGTVLASSRFVAKWLAPLVPTHRLSVIYNGIEGWGLPVPQARSRYTRIGMLGRIAPEKGQLTFVRAAHLAARLRPDLTFLVGGAPMFAGAEYFDEVQRESFSRVEFTGWIQDPSQFLKRIDLLVVPSAAIDANPRVIPEAFAAGLPVIAFDSGGVAELIDDVVTGILVRDHTPNALATAIVNAVDHPTALNAIAVRAYRQWQERFTLERFQSEVCDAVEREVAGRNVRQAIRANATA